MPHIRRILISLIYNIKSLFQISKIRKEHSLEHSFWPTLIDISHSKKVSRDFPGGAVVKNLPANAGDMGSIPGPGRSHMLRSN